jgi:hypothetical protein
LIFLDFMFLDGQIEFWHILNDILDDILSTQGPSQHEERLHVSRAHALSAGGVKSQQAVPREGATLRGQTRVIKTFSAPVVRKHVKLLELFKITPPVRCT